MGGGGMVKWWESQAPRSLPTSPPRTQMRSNSSKSVHWALAMSGYG